MRTPSSLGSAATSLLALFALATSPAAVAAARIVTASITLSIPASQHIPNPSAHLPPSTHATLTTLGGSGGRKPLSAPLTVANTFVFDNVTLGSYLADVHCPIYGFSPLRVDVGAFEEGFRVQVWETYRGNDWENKGEAVPAKQLPGAAPGKVVYEVRVFGRKVFFQDRASFSIGSILKNPMILMGIVSLGMFIGVPKLIENMDPETRAEFESQRKENPVANLMSGGGGGGSGAGGASNFDMAGFLSGHSASKNGNGNGNGSGNVSGAEAGSEVDGPTPSAGASGNGAGGKGGKKRR